MTATELLQAHKDAERALAALPPKEWSVGSLKLTVDETGNSIGTPDSVRILISVNGSGNCVLGRESAGLLRDKLNELFPQ